MVDRLRGTGPGAPVRSTSAEEPATRSPRRTRGTSSTSSASSYVRHSAEPRAAVSAATAPTPGLAPPPERAGVRVTAPQGGPAAATDRLTPAAAIELAEASLRILLERPEHGRRPRGWDSPTAKLRAVKCLLNVEAQYPGLLRGQNGAAAADDGAPARALYAEVERRHAFFYSERAPVSPGLLAGDVDIAESALRVILNRPTGSAGLPRELGTPAAKVEAALRLLNVATRSPGLLQGELAGVGEWPQYQAVLGLFAELVD